MIVVSVLPALLLRAIFLRTSPKARARGPKETTAENLPVVSVTVSAVTPSEFVGTTLPSRGKKISPFATAHKLVLHPGPHGAIEALSPMPELKGARNFVPHR